MLPKFLIQVSFLILITFFWWNYSFISVNAIAAILPTNLKNTVDFHVHSSPDVTPRIMDDFEIAQMASKVKMKAVIFKNHFTSTSDRAVLVNKIVPDVQLFGGIVLNDAVGGLNPKAVEAMYKMGEGKGKVVWFPTIDSAYDNQIFKKKQEGITIIQKGKIKPEVEKILKIIADYNLVLETGHLSPIEVKLLVKKAVEFGVKNIVITHAMADIPGLSLSEMRYLADLGAYLELTYVSNLMGKNSVIKAHQNWHQISIFTMAEAIKIIGARHFVLSTDLGREFDPLPVEGYSLFIKSLKQEGISPKDIDLMTNINPSNLLSIS